MTSLFRVNLLSFVAPLALIACQAPQTFDSAETNSDAMQYLIAGDAETQLEAVKSLGLPVEMIK